jgi:hypothetical protein
VSSILRELADLRRPEATRALARRIGAPEDATARALAAALPTLLSAFSRMTSSPDAARSLLASPDGRPEGDVLADVPRALGALPSAGAEAILEEAVGARRGAVEDRIARAAGIDPVQARAVLAASATLLLAALGRALPGGHWCTGDLNRTLAVELNLAEDAVPGSVGVLEELLEADPDGELGEDVAEIGARLLDRLCDE